MHICVYTYFPSSSLSRIRIAHWMKRNIDYKSVFEKWQELQGSDYQLTKSTRSSYLKFSKFKACSSFSFSSSRSSSSLWSSWIRSCNAATSRKRAGTLWNELLAVVGVVGISHHPDPWGVPLALVSFPLWDVLVCLLLQEAMEQENSLFGQSIECRSPSQSPRLLSALNCSRSIELPKQGA